MALITTDEQEALRDVMRGFLQKFSTESDVRTVMDSEPGYDAAAWRTAAEQIGVQGLAIPEEMGGGGYGFDELAIVMEEAGRTLVPVAIAVDRRVGDERAAVGRRAGGGGVPRPDRRRRPDRDRRRIRGEAALGS